MIKKITFFIILSIFLVGSTFVGNATNINLNGETVTFVNSSGMGDFFSEGEHKARIEEIENKFNCKIEFKDVVYNERIDILESGVMASELSHTVIEMTTLLTEGEILWEYMKPLNDVLDEDYWNKMIPPFDSLKEETTFGNKYYGFDSFRLPYVHLLFWNKDLFEKEGLSNLYDLIESKDWTYDKFLEMAKKVTRDTTGNGEIDQWMYTNDRNDYSVHAFLWTATNNANLVSVIEGQMEYTFDQSEAIQSLQWYVDMINEYAAQPNGKDLFIEGKVAILDVRRALGLGDFEDMEDDWGMAYLPLGPEADDYKVPARSRESFFLPITAQDPESLITITNAITENTVDYQTKEEAIEDTIDDFSIYFRDRESMDILRNAIGKISLQRFLIFPGWPNRVGDIALKPILEGEKTVTQGIREAKSPIQQELYNYFNK